MGASCYLSLGCPCGQICQCLYPMYLTWRGLWILTWHQKPAVVSQQRAGFSLWALAFRLPEFREMFGGEQPWCWHQSRPSPGDNPLAPECWMLGFPIHGLCKGGHFESEAGKNKDNSFQKVEISSHIKKTFVLFKQSSFSSDVFFPSSNSSPIPHS